MTTKNLKNNNNNGIPVLLLVYLVYSSSWARLCWKPPLSPCELNWGSFCGLLWPLLMLYVGCFMVRLLCSPSARSYGTVTTGPCLAVSPTMNATLTHRSYSVSVCWRMKQWIFIPALSLNSCVSLTSIRELVVILPQDIPVSVIYENMERGAP